MRWLCAICRHLTEFWRQRSDVRDGGEKGGWRRRWSASQLWRSTLLSRTQTKKKDSQRVFLTEVGWLFHTHPFINMRLVKSMVLINVTTFTKKRNKIKYWEYQYQPCGHVQVHHGKKKKKNVRVRLQESSHNCSKLVGRLHLYTNAHNEMHDVSLTWGGSY